MGYRLLPVSDLPNVDFPTITVERQPVRARAPRRWPPSVATPLEKQFSTIAGLDAMTSSSSQGSTDDHAAVRPGPRHRRAPPRTCRRRSSRRAARAAAATCMPPSYRKVNPADSPILFLALTSPDAAAVDARRVRRDVPRAAHLDGRGRGAGARLRRAEVRGARPARPAGAGGARRRHRRGGAAPSAPATSTCRPGRCAGRNKALTVEANGQLQQRRGVPPPDRGVPQRRAGAPRGPRAGRRRRAEQQVGEPGSTATARHHARDPAPAGHQHRRGGRRRAGASSSSSRRSCRPRWSCTSCATAPSPSATRSTTSSSRCC